MKGNKALGDGMENKMGVGEALWRIDLKEGKELCGQTGRGSRQREQQRVRPEELEPGERGTLTPEPECLPSS